MIVQDKTRDMEITMFDKQAESMTNINLSLMNTAEEVSRTKISEKINSIIHNKFTLMVGLSQRAIIDNALTYRIYKVERILSHPESSTKTKLIQLALREPSE